MGFGGDQGRDAALKADGPPPARVEIAIVGAGVVGLAIAYNLARRGLTDIAVFDPETVAPGPLRRVRDFPADGERLVADAPVGMTHMLVNGTVIRADGAADHEGLASKPGSVLRG